MYNIISTTTVLNERFKVKKVLYLHCTTAFDAEFEHAYHVSDTKDMSEYDWICMKEFEFEFEPLNRTQAAAAGIAQLQKIETKARVEFEKTVAKLHEKISKLQSLTYEVVENE